MTLQSALRNWGSCAVDGVHADPVLTSQVGETQGLLLVQHQSSRPSFTWVSPPHDCPRLRVGEGRQSVGRTLGVPLPLSLGTRPVLLPSEHMMPHGLIHTVKVATPQVIFQGGGWNLESRFPRLLPQGPRECCRNTLCLHHHRWGCPCPSPYPRGLWPV